MNKSAGELIRAVVHEEERRILVPTYIFIYI